MFTIHEDDYAQTALPRLESDGAVELHWDHPNFPGQWSGRFCEEYPYENWSAVQSLVHSSGGHGVWSLRRIILGRFGLLEQEERFPWERLVHMSPEELRGHCEQDGENP